MSRITELAEEEAARVEAEANETPDTELAQEPEQPVEDAPPAPSPPVSGPGSKNFDRDLDKEDTRHLEALKRLFGDAWADFNTCPLCQVAGYAMQYPPGEVPIEQRLAVMHVLGDRDERNLELAPSDEAQPCPICKGQGRLKTGSLNPEHATKECSACSEKGYVNNLEQGQIAARLQASAPPPPPPTPIWQAQTAAQPPAFSAPNGWTPAPGANGNDSYGRWPGHERYGIDPAANGGLW
jgi:hypothetical protein